MDSWDGFVQKSENVSPFFNAMEYLGKVNIILRGNSTVVFNRKGLNLVEVTCVDTSRAGFLEFDTKDLVIQGYIPSCNLFKGLGFNQGVKQIGFCGEKGFFGENSPFDIKASLDP